MLRLHLAALVAAAFAAAAPAQGDPAPYRQKAEAATKRMAEKQSAVMQQMVAARKSVGDDANKVQGDLDEAANKVSGTDFAAALGQIPIAESHVEYVPEGNREAFLAALKNLQKALEEAAQVRAQADALQLAGDRLESLKTTLQDGGDAASQLRDLDDTVNHLKGSQALTQKELSELRVYLAGHKNTSYTKRMDALREQAKLDAATLDAEYPAIQKSLSEAAERDSAIARFDTMSNTVLESALLLPWEDAVAKDLRARIAKMAEPVRAAYSAASAVSIGERLKANLDFQADQFEGWKEETAAFTVDDYLLPSSTVNLLGFPKTCAFIRLSMPWFAYVAMDPEYQHTTPDPKFAALQESLRKDADAAVAKLLAVAEPLVAEIEKVGFTEEGQRERAAYLASWDLRMALHEHKKQWDLIARVQKLVDAFDRKALGAEAAIAKMREEALKTTEAHWNRMWATVPIAGGFVGDQAGKFRDKQIRVEAGRNYSDEFVAGDFDMVFRMNGELFAAKLDPALKAGIEAQRTRLELKPTPDDEYEIIATVGAEGALGLAGADGKQAATLPCRMLRVFGVRLGPISYLAR
ncbi:MAG: hypothetical protein JNJ88_19510 [Planctomycetes bacterium]|nr:hypothetical protein [Planctomycetota bacterium]